MFIRESLDHCATEHKKNTLQYFMSEIRMKCRHPNCLRLGISFEYIFADNVDLLRNYCDDDGIRCRQINLFPGLQANLLSEMKSESSDLESSVCTLSFYNIILPVSHIALPNGYYSLFLRNVILAIRVAFSTTPPTSLSLHNRITSSLKIYIS